MDTLETYYLLTAKTSSWRKYCVTSKKSAYFPTFDRLFKSYNFKYRKVLFFPSSSSYQFMCSRATVFDLVFVSLQKPWPRQKQTQNKRIFYVLLVDSSSFLVGADRVFSILTFSTKFLFYEMPRQKKTQLYAIIRPVL